MREKKPKDTTNIPDSSFDKHTPNPETPAKEPAVEPARPQENPVPKVSEPTPKPGEPMPMQYTYRWTYGEQTKFDAKSKRKARRGGALTYACMMTLAFLLSFGTLLGVLMTSDFTTVPDTPASVEPQIQYIDRTVYVREPDNDNGILTIPEIASKVKPSVVGIEIETEKGTKGIGTGIIMSADGYIATNAHVVDDVVSCSVILLDNTKYKAEIVGMDEWSDLAVIKVEATNLPAAEFGDSNHLIVGEDVVAIGTPASLEYAGTVTDGIVSAINRGVKIYNDDGTLQKKLTLIQTNVAINPGNSGGPLVNAYGQVIGINSMKLSNGYVGIGFAIPITGAMEILTGIIQNGEYSGNSSLVTKRPLLGVTAGGVVAGTTYKFEDGSTMIAEVDGVIIVALSEGLDAINKLKIGDIITKVDGEVVKTIYDVMDLVNEHNPGDTIEVEFYREGQYHTVSILLGSE